VAEESDPEQAANLIGSRSICQSPRNFSGGSMLKPHFEMLARYNQWANAKLYAMSAALPDEAYRRNVGAYFGSLHGTLNHVLVADRIWMRRLTRSGDHPKTLNAIVCDDFQTLHAARQAEDQRIIQYVAQLTEEQLEQHWEYQTLSGAPQRQLLREILAHMFNHETHHRGQAHAILTSLGISEPDPWDLLIMVRERG
jgi:uncharacterized damage-inducible protein DinB